MIERLLRHMLGLLLALVVLSFLLGLVVGLARHGESVAVASIRRATPPILTSLVTILLTVVFLAGLGVRGHQFMTGRGGRAGREHGARERQVRHAVRRPAEGVPVTTAPELPVDPDPAISMEEG